MRAQAHVTDTIMPGVVCCSHGWWEACEALGLKAHLVELDPRFVDVIVWRWQEATGGVANGSARHIENLADRLGRLAALDDSRPARSALRPSRARLPGRRGQPQRSLWPCSDAQQSDG